MRLPRKIGRGFFEDFPFRLGPLQLLTQPLVLLAQLLQRECSSHGTGFGANLACQSRRLFWLTPTAAAGKVYDSSVTSRTESRSNSSVNRRALADDTDGSTTAGTDCLLRENSFQQTILAPPPYSAITGTWHQKYDGFGVHPFRTLEIRHASRLSGWVSLLVLDPDQLSVLSHLLPLNNSMLTNAKCRNPRGVSPLIEADINHRISAVRAIKKPKSARAINVLSLTERKRTDDRVINTGTLCAASDQAEEQ